MATKNPSGNHGDHACLMCLDAHDSLKILTNCKHIFCCKCLRTHRKSLGKNSFCCPTCQAACPLPGSDINNLLDYNSDDDVEESSKRNRSKGPAEVADQAESKRLPCKSCVFAKNVIINAEYLCEECGNLHLCKGCRDVHRKNKVTENHVVISLKKHREGNCRVHKELINSYCNSCAQPCCHLCILFEHGDHKVEKIGDVFRTLVEELTTITDEQERRSGDLKRFEDQLRYLKGTEVTERRDILIQATEDQAEKCITHILQQKDAQINTIRENHKVITGVVQCLDRVAGLGVLDTTVAKAKMLLAEVETHPADIRQLSAIKQDILDLGIKEDIDIENYWETYQRFHENPVQFVPTAVHSISLGKIQVKQPTVKLWNITNCKSVFEKTMVVDDQAKYIPYVANLGNNFYAIAHPIIGGGRSEAVDIYKFPGELQRTLRDHINPLIDMVATWAGQLAVLSKGIAAETCAVHLFDPETGYIRSTKDFTVRNPLSFDVTLRQQYIILSNDGGNKVTIFNEDGSVELMSTAISGSRQVFGPCRIRYSGVNVYVMGVNNAFDVYRCERKQNTVVRYVASNYAHIGGSFILKDISVVSFNQITACYNCGNKVPFMYTHTQVGNQVQVKTYKQLGVPPQGGNIESRLAVRGKYMVCSQGQTIRVYEEP